MGTIREEAANMKRSAKRIGEAYREMGVEVGREYEKMGLKTAERFRILAGEQREAEKEEK